MFKRKGPFFPVFGIISMALAIVGVWMLSGCDGEDIAGPEGHQVESIVIVPDSASIAVGEQFEFSAFALTAAGDTVDTADLDIEWEWWSSDPNVFTVEPGGMATGENPGEEFCIVEATILAGSSNFTGRDSAFVMVF